MAKTAPFEQHVERYERWFEVHAAAYVSELLAVRCFVPQEARGLEIGVGTGRFAAPLGVRFGLDPSGAMLRYAVARGIVAVRGAAEALPFVDGSFDYALVVTTICFVDSPSRMVAEARRVVRPRGRLVIGFVDRESPIGCAYREHQAESEFYGEAVFHSASEVEELLRAGGFVVRDWVQTLSGPLADVVEVEPVRMGTGAGSFVVVSAERAEGDGGAGQRGR